MKKEQHPAHCKTTEILEFYTLQISWMASNEWKKEQQFNAEHVKNNISVLIQERVRLNVSKNLTICSLMVVFWTYVMNEQWQMINLIYWKFKNPWVDPKK